MNELNQKQMIMIVNWYEENKEKVRLWGKEFNAYYTRYIHHHVWLSILNAGTLKETEVSPQINDYVFKLLDEGR